MKRLILFSILIAVISASCTKNIHLNLQNASGLLVIEGNINDQPGPYTVLLSNTITFYDTDKIVPVSGGRIILSDDAGNRDSLIEVKPGTYRTTFIAGTVGRTYHLSVYSGGKQYDAYSTINPPVPVDSIGVNSLSFFGRTVTRPFVRFQDPGSTANYYNGVIYVNHNKQYKLNPSNDALNNGIETQLSLRLDSSGFNLHDTVFAELDAIDQPMYNYYNSLNSSTLSSQTAAPANPVTNISNNALGYFSAYSATRSRTIVIDANNAFHRIN